MDEEKKSWEKRLELKRHSRVIKRQARQVEGATVRHARRFIFSRWERVSEIRLHIIVWLGGVSLLIALVGIQMMWFQQTYITAAAVDGGTYAEAVRGPIDNLNPLFATSSAEISASHLLFSSLYEIDSSGHINGDVATTMTNDGDKTFTVGMRHDVRWHDGKPLTADDVVFTVGLMKNPAVRSVMIASWQDITVSKVDNYTVKFSLPASYAAFPQALNFKIVPQHLLKDVAPTALRESTFSTNPVGSGPFRLRLLQVAGQSTGHKILHLDANSDYYAGKPRLDHFQLHSYSNDNDIAQALRTGEVSAASDVPDATARSIDQSRYTTDVRSVNSGVYALFNLSQPALKDAAVRQALLTGTDTTTIRDQIFGQPKALYLPFVGGQVAGTEGILAPQFSQNKANKALDAAGWVLKDGVRSKDGQKLRLKVVTRQNDDYEKVLKQLSGQWRKLGVEIDAQVFAKDRFTQDVLQLHDYDVLLDELVIGADPDVYAFWHSKGPQNFSGYSNQTSDDALASARTRSDPALRAAKYLVFAKQWLSDVPAIGIYQSNFIYIHTKSSHALDSDEVVVSPEDHYSTIDYWTAGQGTVYKTP